MERIIRVSKLAAEAFKELEFMRIFLPIISIVGIVIFIAFGLMGIFKKKTIFLGRLIGGEVIKGGWWIEGGWAVAVGVIYLLLGVVLLAVLGPFSLALLGLI